MSEFMWFVPLFFAWSCVELLLWPMVAPRLHQKAAEFWLYTSLHAAAAYGVCLQPSMWLLLPTVFMIAAALFFLPSSTWQRLLLRWLIHLSAMIVVAFYLPFARFQVYLFHAQAPWLWAAAGLLVLVNGVGRIVGAAMAQAAADNDLEWQGLMNGGLWIGRLERLLIYLFMAAGIPAGIGFLVAAKSILRFGETRENQRLAEYVLIGTLASFSFALAGSIIVLRGIEFLQRQVH